MKAIAVCLVFVFVGIIGVFFAVDSRASSGSLWSDGSVVVLRDTAVALPASGDCQTYYQEVYVTELHETRRVCFYGDERLRIGNMSYSGANRAVVKFANSNEAHLLDGICEGVSCRYSADTDTLVTVQPMSQYGRGVVAYKNVWQRIKTSNAPMMPTWYVFDSSSPDYEIKNDAGRYLVTPQFNISDNGEWIVAELYDKGTVIIDTDTFTARHIRTEGYQYGLGMDPSEELAVSNDGKSVAIGGLNAGFGVTDVIDGCGQPLVGDLSAMPGTVRCPTSDLGIGTLFQNMRMVERPHFVGNGHELDVTIASWVTGYRSVTLATKGTMAAPRLKLLSLGDSFTSGEGEKEDKYYMAGTNDGLDKCHLSSRAYPARIASGLGFHDNEAKSVACSGATMNDVVGSSVGYWGQGGRLGESGLKLSVAHRNNVQQQAIDSFQPGKALQSSFITRYNPETITIGVGGNDAGLMGKLRTCAMPGTCEWAQGEGIKRTAGEIRRVSSSLDSLYASIRHSTKAARVFVVGYPNIIEPDGTCDAVTGFLIDHAERVFIKNSVHYLNQVIRAAADKAGFTYIDVENSFEGKELCAANQAQSAMNGLRIGDDISILGALPMLKIIGAETFHPTPTGHQLVADQFLTQYVLPGGGPVRNEEVDGKDVAYWGVEGVTATPQSFATNFAFIDDADADAKRMIIKVPVSSLQANSDVEVTIHSQPTHLASMTIGADGGVVGEIFIPEDLAEGFHTLRLTGKNTEGETVELYQFVTIGKEGQVREELDTSETPVVSSEAKREDTLGVVAPVGSSNNQPPSSGNLIKDSFGALGVLGANDTLAVPHNVQKILTESANSMKQGVKDAAPWLTYLIAFSGVVVALALYLLVRRGWAKRDA